MWLEFPTSAADYFASLFYIFVSIILPTEVKEFWQQKIQDDGFLKFIYRDFDICFVSLHSCAAMFFTKRCLMVL